MINFFLFKKNILFVGKNQKKRRKSIHKIIQNFVKKKANILYKKKEIYFENTIYKKKKNSFYSYFYSEIFFGIQEKKNKEKIFNLKQNIKNTQFERFPNKISFVILHGIDFLENLNQLKLLYLIKSIKNKCFFFATSSRLKKLRKDFKKFFFFLPFIKNKKFEKKNEKKRHLKIPNWYFLKSLLSNKKKKTRGAFSLIFKKKIFLNFVSFCLSKISIKEIIFFKISTFFIKMPLFKIILKSFLSFNLEKSYEFLKISKENNFFSDEILFTFKKFFQIAKKQIF